MFGESTESDFANDTVELTWAGLLFYSLQDGLQTEMLLDVQHSLRTRFDDFRLAAQRLNATAAEIALDHFEKTFTRWTEAEEQALVPALERAGIEGRDVRRELRLEYVQIRELTRFILRQVIDGIRLDDLRGYIENLDRRLRAHETEKERVYYPAAEAALTPEERATLEAARPPE